MQKNVLLVVLLLTVLISAPLIGGTFAASKAQKAIDKAISKAVQKDWRKILGVKISIDGQNYTQVFNKTLPGPGPGPNPSPCPPNTHPDHGICVPDPIPPSPDSIPPLNESHSLRVAAVGDVDCNSAQTKQFDLLNKYHVQVFLLAGDYNYKNGKCVLDDLSNHGFSNINSQGACGNHDICKDLAIWLNTNRTFSQKNFGTRSELSVFTVDANTKFDCSSPQFSLLKGWIEASDAWYNIPIVHQPFVTVKSNHGDNGQFNCYDPMFGHNGINLVIQAHNHNYQKEKVNGRTYLVVGTGHHDSGSSMYPCNSKTDQNGVPALCITGVNGLTIMDLQIDNPDVRHVNGWFLSDNEQIKDSFTIG